jgi:hypothetical protein
MGLAPQARTRRVGPRLPDEEGGNIGKRFLRIPRRVVRMVHQDKITAEDLGLLVCYLERTDYETRGFTARITAVAIDVVQNPGESAEAATRLRRANDRLKAAGVLDWNVGKRGEPVDFWIVGDDFGMAGTWSAGERPVTGEDQPIAARVSDGDRPKPVGTQPMTGSKPASEAGRSQDADQPTTAEAYQRDETRPEQTRRDETKEAGLKSQNLSGDGEAGVEERAVAVAEFGPIDESRWRLVTGTGEFGAPTEVFEIDAVLVTGRIKQVLLPGRQVVVTTAIEHGKRVFYDADEAA